MFMRRAAIFLTAACLAVTAPRSEDAAPVNDAPERAETVAITEDTEITAVPDANGNPRPYFYAFDIPESDAAARLDTFFATYADPRFDRWKGGRNAARLSTP